MTVVPGVIVGNQYSFYLFSCLFLFGGRLISAQGLLCAQESLLVVAGAPFVMLKLQPQVGYGQGKYFKPLY